jgi:hypothetical protein
MKKFLMIAAAIGLASVLSLPALASDTCTGGVVEFNESTTSLTNDLLTGGTSCSMSGYTFSNFDVYTQGGWANGQNVELIVTADSGGTPGLLAISVTSNAGGPGAAGSVGDYILTYEITPGALDLGLGNGTATSITENVCSALTGTYGTTTTCSGSALAQLTVNPTSPTATAGITTVSVDYVAEDVGGGSENFEQVIPEPMTFSLMGVGLLGLGLLRRRQK